MPPKSLAVPYRTPNVGTRCRIAAVRSAVDTYLECGRRPRRPPRPRPPWRRTLARRGRCSGDDGSASSLLSSRRRRRRCCCCCRRVCSSLMAATAGASRSVVGCGNHCPGHGNRTTRVCSCCRPRTIHRRPSPEPDDHPGGGGEGRAKKTRLEISENYLFSSGLVPPEASGRTRHARANKPLHSGRPLIGISAADAAAGTTPATTPGERTCS